MKLGREWSQRYVMNRVFKPRPRELEDGERTAEDHPETYLMKRIWRRRRRREKKEDYSLSLSSLSPILFIPLWSRGD